MGWLDGQVALVTGGGSGIGRAVVARFVEEGARVAVMDRVAARAADLAAQFSDRAIALAGDVAALADNKTAVAATVAAFGRLDVFVGNAGVFDKFAPLADFPEDQLSAAFDELFGVNVKGVLFGAKAAFPELAKTDGSIVLTASIAGFHSAGGGALYTASKHAVVGIIRQLAVEFAPHVRVNGVAPGGTMTDLRGLVTMHEEGSSQFSASGMAERLAAGNPLRMTLMPDDIAGAYLFLASKSARGITGTVVTVDAGSTLRVTAARPNS
jgi:NAD(P)-dependent dehydrogenase (short-subunit alcohol dehydrogenase family)